MKYNGKEITPITKPQIFDPPREMLVWDSCSTLPRIEVVCAITKRNFYQVITLDTYYEYCAEIPEEPKPKRATNIQLMEWLAKGNGVYRFSENSGLRMDIAVADGSANTVLNPDIQILPFGTTEWLEPTLDNMGMRRKRMCDHCVKESSIASCDDDIDAIIDNEGYFNVLNTPADRYKSEMPMADRIAVFKFAFCPMCGRKLGG